MKLKLLFLMIFAATSLGYAQITAISIVGEAAGGWPGDPNNPGPIDLHQMTSTDGENWTLSNLVLSGSLPGGGGLKFRANNDWTLNWGSPNFPTGIGTQGGANIQCIAGIYTVTFNSTTGDYAFSGGTPVSVAKLIGTAIADPLGISMTTIDSENYKATNVTLVDGTAQFDIDSNLYGETNFPYGVLSGAANMIPVIGGNYSSINLNIATGAYSFVTAPIYPVISITGTAVGGSGDGFDFDMTTTDGIHYSIENIGTIDGEIKFRTDHAWTLNYSSTSFPSGIAILNGAAIPVPSGNWNITFNLTTGDYLFTGNTSSNPTIAIVGSGAGGWPGDPNNPGPLDVHQMTTTDGITYSIYALTLTDGEVKFRQDNNWTLNWGSFEFPTGIGTQGGNNIVSVAGTYSVTFNRITGEYNFSNPLRIAIVGSGAGGWPTGAVGEVDTNQLLSTDGVNFRLDGITLTYGEVKFRQNNSWDVNWGGTSLSEALVLNGPNIPTSAGIYTVSMNRVIGTYTIVDAPLATTSFNASNFKVYPNPTDRSNTWNFTSLNKNIETIQIVDVLGKTVMTIAPAALNAAVDASSLKQGLYFAKVATTNATETVKLIKN